MIQIKFYLPTATTKHGDVLVLHVPIIKYIFAGIRCIAGGKNGKFNTKFFKVSSISIFQYFNNI